MFLVNSRLGLGFCGHPQLQKVFSSPGWHPFSRSYGVNLQSSLTRVFPFTLACSARPTCVGLQYGRSMVLPSGFFSAVGASMSSLPWKLRVRSQDYGLADLPTRILPTPLHRTSSSPGTPKACCVTASVITATKRGRNVYLLAIAYAFRPRLRSRLTLGGSTFPGILGLPVNMILTCFALLMPAFSLPYGPPSLTTRLLPIRNAPLLPRSSDLDPKLRLQA